MKTSNLIHIVELAIISNSFAVDPPPDGAYANQNTAEGENALFNLSLGADNTAIGFESLFNNTIGQQNTGVGSRAMHANTTGIANTAIGDNALSKNTKGSINTAVGESALGSNTSGSNNTAVGEFALGTNDIGTGNTAVGEGALRASSEGTSNTAVGTGALAGNRNGNFNTGFGVNTLFFNKGGSKNTAIGITALYNLKGGSSNVAIGYRAGSNLTKGDHNIDIANNGVAGESNTMRIGKSKFQTATYIAGISGATIADGAMVIIDNQGHLGTLNSSVRYKEAITPMKDASESILSLKPVTFRYKKELDPKGIPQFGLVAEDVAEVDRNLVANDAKGNPYTVRYEAINAMLLNEFLKEHKKVEELEQQLHRMAARLDAKGL
jgi:hypothetical protein